MSLLSLQDLHLSIHGTPILHGVSLNIAPGEVFGLVGESGSGKSLTAFAAMRLLPEGARVTGGARLGGTDLLAATEAQMCAIRGRDMGMIFQEPMTALNPVQTIGDQVAETLVIHGAASRAEARRAARAMLDRVGLTADRFPLDRYPHELSGGQRQRVCIAMAIALRPRLLIADEPTTALDVTTQAQILTLLKRLVAEEGMALMLITHDLAVVAGMADRVAVMQAGRIVEEGPTADLFRTRAHDYTRRLFAASEHRPARIPQPQGEALLTVTDARRSYALPGGGLFAPARRVEAVRGVSFTLHAGESLGLVGESGCGKSTLSRAILGLEPLQAGAIRLWRQPVGPGMDPAMRAGVQAVFQDPYGSFNPRWTVGRLVAEPFHLMPQRPDDAKDRVAAALADVGLSAADMGKYIHEFSGGQRQRIAIARALVTRPDLIVLDEAVSALDVRVRAQVLDLLADLQGRLGLAYLFISHDLHVVRAITDRVLVMQAGEIVEEGPTETVFSAPRHPYTAELIAATPRIGTALAGR
ncbi:ABC transporter ATP-binding protein [Ruixingdingia sedimenti]|uniref:ABC transporter ATP-binding protein n=1 Tax=Ruixingdingia sedimenti TaxID=3073604 RepID=A0ABU1FCR3_9RHOB|nr:ABC transporter ATP-binding protein [Xinfangfangia sp. LG-4]MDR5654651.1 ABC transporter ATP-binding protein [Xinfangfangia sp. LG-4]